MPLKDAVFSVREFAGHSLKFSIENSLAYDTRDYRLLPSAGVYCRLTQELAGLLGDASFAKQTVDLQVSLQYCFAVFNWLWFFAVCKLPTTSYLVCNSSAF